jgi:catechol 2,3-dioxygenase
MNGRSYGVAPPHYRLPDDTKVGAVRLQVTDLPRSVDYYQRVIGLRPLSLAAQTASLGAESHDRPLVVLDTRRGVLPSRRGAYGLYHFAILVPDRGTLARFAAHLQTTGVRAGMADHLVSEALYLWDPDGLGIEVYADRPRQQWRQNERELVMTTEPLNVAALIEAGGHQPWTGMPSGTTIGHVHLHVGSLDQAEAFYHAALGLEKMVWSYPGALFLAAGGYHHHLGTNVWSTGPAARENEARLIEWELVVPDRRDVAAVADSSREAGYDARTEAHVAIVADPWGTDVRVTADGDRQRR